MASKTDRHSMKFNKYILIAILFIQLSCQSEFSNGYSYPNDTNISDNKGNIVDSNILFLPNKICRKNHNEIITGMDTLFSHRQYSLWNILGEKILYNYYLGYDQIRFFWFHALRREQYVFRFVQDNEKYKVFLKIIRDNKLKRDQDSVDFVKSIEFNEYAKKNYQKYLEQKKYFETDSIINFNGQSEIAYCKPIEISKDSWNKLISLLDSSRFWNTSPNNYREVLDGETWITEVHFKNSYWFKYETSPLQQNRKPGEYAIRLIGLTDR